MDMLKTVELTLTRLLELLSMVFLYSLEFQNLEWTLTQLHHIMELKQQILHLTIAWETTLTLHSIIITQCLLASYLEL